MKVPMHLEGKISVVYFKEGDQVVAYCHALDLSSCGSTKSKAEKAFLEAVEILFEEVVSLGTAEQFLKGLGWRVVRNRWVGPSFIGEKSQKISVSLA